MIDVINQYLFALLQVAVALWSCSAMVYVWYRVWYVERMWQEPNSEKSEVAIYTSGEIFEIAKALMIVVGGLAIGYGTTFALNLVVNI